MLLNSEGKLLLCTEWSNVLSVGTRIPLLRSSFL